MHPRPVEKQRAISSCASLPPPPLLLNVGEHGAERQERERESAQRPHSPFALHAPIQRAVQGYVIKKRGRSNGGGTPPAG